MAFSLIQVLVKKLISERYDIQIFILQTLYNCIRLGKEPLNPADAIKANALNEFNKVLKSSITDVKVWSCKCIMVLWYLYFTNSSFFAEAKKIACSGNTIQNLLLALSDNKSEVRSAAAGALMRFLH